MNLMSYNIVRIKAFINAMKSKNNVSLNICCFIIIFFKIIFHAKKKFVFKNIFLLKY